jgi:hypothetical protein
MDPVVNKNPTIEEVLTVISKTAKDTGVDDFRIRVQRRRTAGGMPEQVLTMDGALAEHFSSPETWLPRIAGGGLFIVSAYHVSNVANMVGGPYPVQVDGQSREPDPSVVEEQGWKGPRICVFPKPVPKNTTPQIMTIPGGPDVTPRNVAPVPSGEGRPNNSVEQALAAQLADMQRREQALFARQAQVEIEAAKAAAAGKVEQLERKLEEERRRNEEDRRRAEEERRRAANVPVPVVEQKSDLIATLAPLALEFLKSDREFKQQALQMQIAAAERQAAATSAASAEQSKQMAAVLASIANKPAIDPQLFALLTKEDSSAKVLSNMSELFATQASTTMNVLNSMVEMGLAGNQREPEEPQALKIVREGVKAFVALSGGAARAVQAQPQQQQLPQPRVVEAVATPEPEGGLRAAEPNALEQFIGQVRDDKVEPGAAAAFILDHLSDPSVLKAYLQADSDLRLVLVNNLGEDWLEVPANAERARGVMKSTLELGVERGILDEEVLKGMDALLESIG